MAEQENGESVGPADFEEKDVWARYVAMPMCGWVDVREAKPRCRISVADDGGPATVTVTNDGVMHTEPDSGVIIDVYDYDTSGS